MNHFFNKIYTCILVQSVNDFSNPYTGNCFLCNFRNKALSNHATSSCFSEHFSDVFIDSLIATQKTGYRANGQSVHCPFEGRADIHQQIQPDGLAGQYYLGSRLKGQCKISKFLFPLVLSIFIEKNIFFPDTYNLYHF